MKTAFKLTEKNAAAVLKYSKIVSADPDEFLNRLVYDFCTWAFDEDTDIGARMNFLNNFEFKTRAAAERYRAWLTDLIMKSVAKAKVTHTVLIRVEENNKGLFCIKGTWSYNGMSFNL
jgi:hypothetical protein